MHAHSSLPNYRYPSLFIPLLHSCPFSHTCLCTVIYTYARIDIPIHVYSVLPNLRYSYIIILLSHLYQLSHPCSYIVIHIHALSIFSYHTILITLMHIHLLRIYIYLYTPIHTHDHALIS